MCGLSAPLIVQAECCGDQELDSSTTTIAIGRELSDAQVFVKNALNSIPYVSGASVGVSGSIAAQDICCNENIITNGKKDLSGTLSGSITASKTLSPIDIPITYTIPGTTCTTGITLRAGPLIGVTAELSLNVTGEINSCSNTRNLSGSANASGTATAGLVAVAGITACGYDLEAKGNATASTGITGGVSYSSNGGSSYNICFQDLTADIGISICIGTWNCSLTVARGYVLVKGNC